MESSQTINKLVSFQLFKNVYEIRSRSEKPARVQNSNVCADISRPSLPKPIYFHDHEPKKKNLDSSSGQANDLLHEIKASIFLPSTSINLRNHYNRPD